MSVRLSLLALLDQGDCYGYQLRTEYERRTGAGALNVGQVYTTLERLERDGLVARRGADERGHVYWGITEPGRGAVRGWFDEPEPRGARDDLVHKIALAATLPGVDALAIVAAQRDRAAERMAGLGGLPAPGDLRALIVDASARAHARADLDWLDAVALALRADPGAAVSPLSADRPRRGRPARDANQENRLDAASLPVSEP